MSRMYGGPPPPGYLPPGHQDFEPPEQDGQAYPAWPQPQPQQRQYPASQPRAYPQQYQLTRAPVMYPPVPMPMRPPAPPRAPRAPSSRRQSVPAPEPIPDMGGTVWAVLVALVIGVTLGFICANRIHQAQPPQQQQQACP